MITIPGAFGTNFKENIDTILKTQRFYILFTGIEESNRIYNSNKKNPDNCNCLIKYKNILFFKKSKPVFISETCKLLPTTGFLQSLQQEFPAFTQR